MQASLLCKADPLRETGNTPLMRMDPSPKLFHAVANIYDAATDPAQWPSALAALSDTAGAIGACCVIVNTKSDIVEWISFSGPCADLGSEYIKHYAPLDPYTPIVAALPAGSRVWLSDVLPHKRLKSSEWYNDFLKKYEIGDIFGGKILEKEGRVIMFGLQVGNKRADLSQRHLQEVKVLQDALGKAAYIYTKLRNAGWMSSATIQALDQLAAAIIVIGPDGRVVDLNSTAEHIVQAGDGLVIRNGRLGALRSIDQARISAAIDSATTTQGVRAASREILVARREGRPSYVLTVAPMNSGIADHVEPLAIVLVVNPEWRVPSADAIVRTFGLSPAECRLAMALMQGKRMNDIARTFGVEITTIRTQLSSILKKVGVQRQSDLIRVLGDIGILTSSVRAGGGPAR
jgi:DNA-binding CsgD family transcriptional regulator